MNIAFWNRIPTIVRAILFFGIFYASLTGLLIVSAPPITRCLVPVYALVIENAYPENELVSIESAGNRILYRMKITKHFPGIDLPLVDYVSEGIYASFQFVVCIIYYSLLFAWPALSVRKKLKAFLISLPVLLAFISIDIPVTIMNSVDLACLHRLRGIALEKSLAQRVITFFSHFFNNGGRQFFAVLLFAATVMPFRFGLPSNNAIPKNAKSSGKRKNAGKT